MSDRKRALVTGIHGFTGRYLAAELERNGYEVFGLGHGNAGGPGYFSVDLDDAAALGAVIRQVQPDVVAHLAALAFVGHGNVDDFYRVNLVGTRHLLEAIEGSGCEPSNILISSSANVYGNAPVSVLGEETPPAPANDYAVSKLAMEYMARLWSDRLPITMVRPFNYTGVGQERTFLLPKIVAHFRARADSIELGNIDISRDFSDVRTVVNLYRRLLETPCAVGQLYNVCSGRSYTLREVIGLCEELSGHHLEIQVNPALVRANEVKTLRGDDTRLRSVLGSWDAIGLRETLAWMIEAGTLQNQS